MKYSKIFLFLIFVSSAAYSQNIDSLYYEYLHIRSITGGVKTLDIQTEEPDGKCSFGIAHELRQNMDQLSFDKRNQLQVLLYRPEKDTSIVSPSGIFRIHYDLSGIHAPSYDVMEAAIAYDSSYNYEVNILGYPPHRSDEGEGGDDKFDVYIERRNNYGETVFDNPNEDGLYQAYIRMDNDFSGFYTEGIDGARVTAAHEYHHAIQVCNYGFFSDERYFYELTSTSMEEFVYDDINDYYGYIPLYFRMPYRAFADWGSDGYRLVLWHLYLQQRFAKEGEPTKGFDIIKRCWEILKIHRVALPAIRQAMFEFGASFEKEFNNFGLWCYFTEYRQKPGQYFDEAEFYPLIRPLNTYNYEPPRKEYFIGSEPVSNNYLVFDLSYSGFPDTLVSVITNSDVENGVAWPFTGTDFNYILLTEEESGSNHIMNEYYSIIESDYDHVLFESNIFNNEIAAGGILEREVLNYAFPQPFRYAVNNFIYIPTELNEIGYADVNIYTTSMDLVYADKKKIFAGDKIVVQWDGKGNNGNKLPTGVYIYVTNSDDKVHTGKLVIYNE